MNNRSPQFLILLASLMIAINVFAADDVWIDVRTDEEWNAGHLQGAAHISFEEISDKIATITEDKDAPIKLYCRSGRRAGVAKESLEKMGYTNVVNVGGLEDAKKAAGQDK